VLNQPQYAGASILVAGPDFGTGSSREHANWALLDGGFRVVISSRFADIFRNNSTKAGLLTVILPQADVEALWAAVEADPATAVTVDLQAEQVRYGEVVVPFQIDGYTRWRLLEGLDDVGLTERHLEDIAAFEDRRPAWLPRSLPA
jgi:3-isopropylmalate/(R)-2-methylmalate dehydratase small subunit